VTPVIRRNLRLLEIMAGSLCGIEKISWRKVGEIPRRPHENAIKRLNSLALPREARDSSICNELAPGLGKMPGIELQGVSVAAPKLFGADRSVRPRVQ
jgi:hypothetical protein